MNVNYQKFSHELSLMAKPGIDISFEKGQLLLKNLSSAGFPEESEDDSKLIELIADYFTSYGHLCKPADADRLSKIKDKLITAHSTEKKKISALFESLITKVQSDLERPAPPQTSISLNIAYQVTEIPVTIEEFKANLRMVLNHYPRLQFDKDLAVYDTAYGNLPEGWDLPEVYHHLKNEIEKYRMALNENSEADKIVLEDLKELHLLIDDLMKPFIPVQIGIVIETLPIGTTNSAMYFNAHYYIKANKPLIINRYLLEVHGERLAGILQNSSLYIQKDGELCVIVPKGKALEEIGFNGSQMKLVSLKEAKTFNKELNFAKDLEMILLDSNEKGRFSRLVFFNGHGMFPANDHNVLDPMKEGIVVGLKIAEFQQALKVLNPAVAGINTCFAGGENIHQIHLPDGTISCPILIQSSFETTTYSFYGDPFQEYFLRDMETLLFSQRGLQQRYPFARQVNAKDIQNIVTQITQSTRKIHVNLPQVVMPITKGDALKAYYSMFYNDDEIIDVSKMTEKSGDQADEKLYLFSQPIIKKPLQMGSKFAGFISKGSTGHHLIEEIQAPDQEIEEIVDVTFNAFNNNFESAPKAFFIGKMHCRVNGQSKIIKQVLIKSFPNSKELMYKVEGEEGYRYIKYIKVVSTLPGDPEQYTWEQEKVPEEKILTLSEASKLAYSTALQTRPSVKALTQTTQYGKESEEDFLRALKKSFWGDERSLLEVRLFAAIANNRTHFKPPLKGDKEKVRVLTDFDTALEDFKHDDRDSKEKRNILKKVIKFNKQFGNKVFEQKLFELPCTPLMYAVQEGSLKDVLKIVNHSSKTINTRELNGATPLSTAVRFNKIDIVKLLIKKGAFMDGEGNFTNSPLGEAIRAGHFEIVSLFLQNGLDVSGKLGARALKQAIKNKTVAICHLLVDYNAGINDSTHLLSLTGLYSHDFKPLLERLIQYPNININQKVTDKAIKFSVYYQNSEALKLLLAKNANPNAVDAKEDRHPLCWFKGDGDKNIEVATLLLNAGANINATDAKGRTPLDYAILGKQIRLAYFFLQKGGIPNAASLNFMLSEGGFKAILETKEVKQWQLHYALLKGDLEKANELMNQGAKIDGQVHGTPIFLAYLKAEENKQWGQQNKEVVQFFLAHIKLDKCIDKENNCALHYATKASPEILQMLIDHKAPLRLRNFKGETPLVRLISKDIKLSIDGIYFYFNKMDDLEAKDVKYIVQRFYALQNSNNKAIEELEKFFIQKFILSKNVKNSFIPLLQAIITNNFEKTKQYFQKMDFEKTKIFGIPVLHLLAHYNSYYCKLLLPIILERIKNIDGVDKMGNTFLHVLLNNPEVFEDEIMLVINQGANFKIKESNQKTALDIAKEKKLTNILEFMEEKQKKETLRKRKATKAIPDAYTPPKRRPLRVALKSIAPAKGSANKRKRSVFES